MADHPRGVAVQIELKPPEAADILLVARHVGFEVE